MTSYHYDNQQRDTCVLDNIKQRQRQLHEELERLEVEFERECQMEGAPLPPIPEWSGPPRQLHRPVPDGYAELADILDRALHQASHGKGKERHATGRPFVRQPMQAISDMLGSADGLRYQALKKTQESTRLPHDRAVAELLGAIVYTAGAILNMERNRMGEGDG